MRSDNQIPRGSPNECLFALVYLLWLAACLLGLFARPAFAQVTHGPARIRNVYIPADQLELLFDDASKGVLMPREKILSLWKEARDRSASKTVPPADVVLSQATYEAQLADHQLRMTGRISIAKLRDDWQTVDLPFGGLAIELAQLDGHPARFGRKRDGTLFLILEKPGRFDLKLQMSAPLASRGGDLATTLRLPPVPASEIVVRLDAGKQLQVGETTHQPERVDSSKQVFRIAVDHTGLAPLVISDRRASGNRTPLILASSRSIAQIEPAGLHWQVDIDLDVFARATDTFELRVPDNVEVAEVESPQLDRWTIHEQADGTAIIKLAFRKPLLGRRRVRLLALAPIPADTQWNMPTLKAPQAASHVGNVAVYCSPSLRVEAGTATGIRPARLPQTTASKSRSVADAPLTFAFWNEAFKLPLRVTPRRRTVQASVATLIDVDRTGLTLRVGATLEPRYAPIFNVQIQLPRNWDVTSVFSAGKPIQWETAPMSAGDAADGESLQTVRFDLAEPLKPGKSLEIALRAERHPHNWLERDEAFSEITLPNLRLLGVDEVEGTLRVQTPAEIELQVSDLSDDLQPVAAEGADDAVVRASGTALQYYYQDDARTGGRIRVRTKAAKIAARTLAFVRLDRGKLDMHYQLDLDVRHGKIRQLGFTLPAAVGEKIQITPLDTETRVIEQRCVPPDGDDVDDTGLNLWQIVFDRPVTGNLTLALDFGQTFSTQASDTEFDTSVEVPSLILQNVSRQSGIVAVEAAIDQQIDCKAENLRDLDPADVLKPKTYVPSQRIVAAYQYPRLPYSLEVSATSHASQPVLTAICESADIISVAANQDKMRHRARFRLRSPNLQQLAVKLPAGADLWSVMFDGGPVEVRRIQGSFIVPMPIVKSVSANDPRELTLLYETDIQRQDENGLSGMLCPETISQNAPDIGLTTLATTWRVYPPDDSEVVSSGGDFQPAAPLTRPSLASWLAESITENSTSSWSWKFSCLVVAFVFAGFYALVKKAGGCQMKLVEILVVIVVIGVLIALLLPAVQSSREAARRAACVNNLKQIGLALHNYHDAYGQFPPAVIGPEGLPRERQFSWIVALLPFLEQQGLYEQLRLDLPCDHPHNAALLRFPISAVLCPSDATDTLTTEGFSKTSYVAVTGADSTLGPGTTRGVIGFDRGLGIDEITDGTSNTLLVAEVVDGGPWFAGGYGTARRINDWIGKDTWSGHPGVGNFLFADGSVQSVSEGIDPQTLRHLATAQGGDSVDEFFDDTCNGDDYAVDVKSALPASSAPAEMEKYEDPFAEKTTSKDEPSPQVAQQAQAPGDDRARLSLRLDLETRGDRAISFRREGGPGQLQLGLQNRTFTRTLECFMVAVILLAAWIWRRASGPRRGIALVMGLAVPLGLSGLVPLAWTPLLDGLLLGTLAAGCLWILAIIVTAFNKTVPAATTAAVAVVVSILFHASVVAAEPKPDAAIKLPASTVTADQSNLTLFIPYDPNSEKPLKKTQVYLPHDEFLRLWRQVHPDKPDRAPPSVRAIVSFAEYTGLVEGDVAHFDGRLLVHHLVDDWTRVELPLGNVALEKIEIDGHLATLAGDDSPNRKQGAKPNVNQAVILRHDVAAPIDDRPAIYLDKPGLHVVDVRFSLPVSRLGETGRMTVPLLPVSCGRLLLRLPGKGLDVQIGGCPGGWRRHTPVEKNKADGVGGESISIPLGEVKDLTIGWQPRHVELRERQLASADQALLIEVLDSGVHLHSSFHYRIQQGALGKLRLRIPRAVAVTCVHGAEVADWSIETKTDSDAGSDSGSRHLVISLKAEQTTGTDVDIDCFRRDLPTNKATLVDSLEPLDVVRETGRVAIGSSSSFRVRVGDTNGLDQIDRSNLTLPRQPSKGCDLLSAYRYTARPWQLHIQAERLRPQVEAFARTAVAVTTRQVTLRSLLSVNVSGAPKASLVLRLPAALRVAQVRVPMGADWFIDGDEPSQQLKIKLKQPAVGKLNLAVSGTLVRDSSQAELVVPGVIVEGTQAQRGQLAIYLDDDLEAVLTGDGGARSINPAALDGLLRLDGSRPVRYAFAYESPPQDLRLRLSAAPSRANGDVITIVSVREGSVTYVSKVGFEIRQAARSHFRIATPLWLGNDVEIEGDNIRQIRSQVSGQIRIWDIELQRPVRGSYTLHLTQTLPLADDGAVSAAVIRPLDVERSRSHIVLENMTANELAATVVNGAAPVSINLVPEGLSDAIRRQAVAAYRVSGDAAKLVWQRRVREQESGLTASINLTDITTVIHADGGYCTRAAYNIRNFTLQFLELELPPDAQVWSVHVSGQPVRPTKISRQGRTITLLPLQKTSAGDFSSKVAIVYSGRLAKSLRRWTRVQPQAPLIRSDVPVSRTLWTVLLPREYAVSLVKNQSNLEEVAAAYQQEERKLSFLDELQQIASVASIKSRSAARSKALYNLKQVGGALQDYARQSSQVDASNAANVQQQAQQIEAEINRLNELKADTVRADGDTSFYFKPLPQKPKRAATGVDLNRGFEQIPELIATGGKTVQKKLAQEQPAIRGLQQRRGDMRKQAAEQLEKLQTMPQKKAALNLNAPSQISTQLPPQDQKSVVAGMSSSFDERLEEQPPQKTQAEMGAPAVAAGTGNLSLDLDVALVGTAYHFRKLHGEPRLVLSARHENLTHWLTALIWAGLCLALAVTTIQVLRRPNAAAIAQRRWPWLAALAGTTWLFLLPAGVFGFALLATSLCVLMARLPKQKATRCKKTLAE